MGAKERRDQYLAKAKEAEDHAAHSRDRFELECLLRIAASYRELARHQGMPEDQIAKQDRS